MEKKRTSTCHEILDELGKLLMLPRELCATLLKYRNMGMDAGRIEALLKGHDWKGNGLSLRDTLFLLEPYKEKCYRKQR